MFSKPDMSGLKSMFSKKELSWLKSKFSKPDMSGLKSKFSKQELSWLKSKLSKPSLSGLKDKFPIKDMKNIGSYIYYLLLFVLFFIGIFVVVPHEEEQNFTAIYILFVIVNLILFYRQYITQSDLNRSVKEKYLPVIILRILFPSSAHSQDSSNLKIVAQFFVLWVFLYVLISLFRMTDNTDEAFSPIGLLSSYCFLKILDYMRTYFEYDPIIVSENIELNNEIDQFPPSVTPYDYDANRGTEENRPIEETTSPFFSEPQQNREYNNGLNGLYKNGKDNQPVTNPLHRSK